MGLLLGRVCVVSFMPKLDVASHCCSPYDRKKIKEAGGVVKIVA
jgi:hypothetical protein